MRLKNRLNSQKRVSQPLAQITYNLVPKNHFRKGGGIVHIVQKIKGGGHRPILPAVITPLMEANSAIGDGVEINSAQESEK